MTADNLLENAVYGLMQGDAEDKADYTQAFLKIINILLQQNFYINNALRFAHDKEELENVPQIGELSEELTYEDNMINNVLPFGVAAYLYMEDEPAIAQGFMEAYEMERNKLVSAKYVVINDV